MKEDERFQIKMADDGFFFSLGDLPFWLYVKRFESQGVGYWKRPLKQIVYAGGYRKMIMR